MINEQFAKRFAELADKSENLEFRREHEIYTCVPHAQWFSWATSVQNLIQAAFGEDSSHYRNFTTMIGKCDGQDAGVEALQGIFRGAKEDFDGGYVFNVDLRVSGQVFGDFVLMAKTALDEGHKDVAAVLACAALEDALKR